MSADLTSEARSGWIAGMRELLDVLEQNPSLPLPELAPRHPLTFYLSTVNNPPAVMAALEAAIPAEFTGRTADGNPGDSYYYELAGTLRGLSIRLRAAVRDVAERRVTGTQTVEVTEWVRLPVEPELPGDSEGEDDE